jgi:uncharacterized membrane protein
MHVEPAVRPPAQRRGQKIALGVFAVVVLADFAWIVARFGTFNPDRGRVPLDESLWFIPLLMVHIVCSSIALLTCVLQIWPWLRSHHPSVHRASGRLYVLAGVYPGAVTSLVLTAFWPWNPIAGFSDTLSSVLWLVVTTYGFVLARQGRTADHRRWMLRSVALTSSVLVNTLVFVPVGLVLQPMLPTWFGGDEQLLNQVWAGLVVWLGWTLPFLAVSWWLEHEQLRRPARRPAVTPSREPTSVA